jgi:hypothetical protein
VVLCQPEQLRPGPCRQKDPMNAERRLRAQRSPLPQAPMKHRPRKTLPSCYRSISAVSALRPCRWAAGFNFQALPLHAKSGVAFASPEPKS